MTDLSIPSLTTPDLVLRAFIAADAADLFAVYQTGVLQYFPNPNPPALEKLERFIAIQQAHWQKHGYGNWAVTEKADPLSRVIGWVGLQFLPELNETEVGYLLGRAYWGKGYATQAARASLEFGFNHSRLPHIIALVAPENTASLRVAAKCGLAPQETIQLWGMTLIKHRLDNPG